MDFRENEREFKGVWIDKEIWFDDNLTMLEKGILVEIDSLDNSDDGCFASNEYLAKFCKCTETKVSITIKKLIKLGYLKVIKFDGRKRYLKSNIKKVKVCLKENYNQPLTKLKSDFNKIKDININNNKDNKKERNIYIDEFDKLWDSYPKKQGKTNASKKYINLREKNKITFEQVETGIEAYNEYIRKNKIEKQFIKQGSTWFNQECWNDDYGLEENKEKDNVLYQDGDYYVRDGGSAWEIVGKVGEMDVSNYEVKQTIS